MKPIDLRNLAFAQVRRNLTRSLASVHQAWAQYGPGTTRELALKSGIDILTVRPRTTDLMNLGLLELCGRNGAEGIYRARTAAEWEQPNLI